MVAGDLDVLNVQYIRTTYYVGLVVCPGYRSLPRGSSRAGKRKAEDPEYQLGPRALLLVSRAVFLSN
jgi:hypothetical protein